MHVDNKIQFSIGNFIKRTDLYKDSYTPVFFRLNNADSKSALQKLLDEKPYIQIFDCIDNQLQDLVKGLNPRINFSTESLNETIKDHLNGTDKTEYGVWVYYAWIEKIVHILDEDEFIMVRTNRNKHKITDEEQNELSKKKIGVIGLSVGQSVSLTLAIERGCGELRIADFDVLDLTNLNRIRSGVQNVGLKKTVIVAREIAEIDPFLKVTCFHDGINEENIEKFLMDNGKLDLLIDECDGIDIKVLCRIKAKKHNIPVLMEASDRGTIDIERFDLEPERPIIHGFVEHLDTTKLKYLKTNEEKIPYILPIAGVETLSTRMKASMLEIQQTITSWPQLASAVTYGGGITADLSRRILLNQLHVSGRYFVDIEEIISDNTESSGNQNPSNPASATPSKGIDFNDISAIINNIKLKPIHNKAELSKKVLDELISTARKAGSAGNNQPWKWYFDNNTLYLFHDSERSLSFANHKNSVAYIGFGLALESIRLKAESLGLLSHEEIFPDPRISNLIAVIHFTKLTGNFKTDPLAGITRIRKTNRNAPKTIKPIPFQDKQKIKEETEKIKGAKIYFSETEEQITTLSQIIGESDKLRLFTSTGHSELFNLELRWSKEESLKKGDGLDLQSFNLTPGEAVGMRIAKDPKVMALLKEWQMGSGLERLSRKQAAASSAIGLITMPSYEANAFINGGKAVERMWITANQCGISVHPMTASIFHLNILKYGQELDTEPYLKHRFTDISKSFAQCFPIPPEESYIFLFRLFYADKDSSPSHRLPLNQIFMSNITKNGKV